MSLKKEKIAVVIGALLLTGVFVMAYLGINAIAFADATTSGNENVEYQSTQEDNYIHDNSPRGDRLITETADLNNGRETGYFNVDRLMPLQDHYLTRYEAEVIVAEILYKHFDAKPEGFLTNVRSRIVQRESLNHIALGLGLDKLLDAEQGKSHTKHNIFGNAIEALIGAIYLDKGYAVCYNFVEKKVIKSFVNIDKIAHAENNFKSKLLEWGQKNRKEIIFELIEETIGEKNNPNFRTRILIQGEEISQGWGNSKKKSQQLAAKSALKKIRK